MTHSAFKQQALDSNKREQLIAVDSIEIPLTDIRAVEISPYHHNIYASDKLIASITHDSHDFVTQRSIVIINNIEIHRANTWAKCYHYIKLHYNQRTLPIQREKTESATTTNDTSYQIAAECENFGFKLDHDGIYYNDVKLGEVGCTDDRWWVYRASSEHQLQIPCNSVYDAVWSLWMAEVSNGLTQSPVSFEQSGNYSIKSQALNFLPSNDNPDAPIPIQAASELPIREPLKHLLIGSPKAVTSTIRYFHQLGYAQVGDWSPLLPTVNPGEVMSILSKQILVQA